MKQLFVLMLGLSQIGCEFWKVPEEEPPSRLRSLKQPRWENQPGDTDEAGVVNAVGARTTTETPTPMPEATYQGVTQKVLEVFRRTELREARGRALDDVTRALSEADVSQAFAAIQSGRPLEATVGIALLARYYEQGVARDGEGKTGPRWDRLEEAYRTLFQSVPSLRLSPEHLAEYAVTLAMLGKYGEALAEARAAEELFRALPVGDDTRPHLSRLAQAQAWSYEGLAREALKNGVPDQESRSLEQLAVVSWEKYLGLMRSARGLEPTQQEELERAEEHLGNLRQSLALDPESAGGKK